MGKRAADSSFEAQSGKRQARSTDGLLTKRWRAEGGLSEF
jgi:hypothetical protein